MVKKKQKVDKVIEQEGSLIVSRTVLGKRSSKTKKIRIRPFVTHPASVSVKYGQTIPTGSYGSVRVDVMLTVPAYVEEILDVYKEVRATVDKLMEKESVRFEVERDKVIK